MRGNFCSCELEYCIYSYPFTRTTLGFDGSLYLTFAEHITFECVVKTSHDQ